MKRVWRISDELFLHRASSKSKTLSTPSLFNLTRRDSHQRLFTREICVQTPNVVGLFSDKWSSADARAREDLLAKVSKLRDELVSNFDNGDEIARILEVNGVSLFDSYSDGSAFVELLKQLCSSPSLALEVFNWRRKQAELSIPMTSEEYAKGIAVAGRMRNVDLALEIFTEAANKRLKTTSTYNDLMGAYMFNSFAEKCHCFEI